MKKKSDRAKIIEQLKQRLTPDEQPELSEEIPGAPCGSFGTELQRCGRIVNCVSCAERRRQIDTYADSRPLGPSEIRENVRRSWDRLT